MRPVIILESHRSEIVAIVTIVAIDDDRSDRCCAIVAINGGWFQRSWQSLGLEISHMSLRHWSLHPIYSTFALTKGQRSKRQLSKLFTVAIQHLSTF